MTNIISGGESGEVGPFFDEAAFRLDNGLAFGEPGFLSRLL